jgi:hypothetical protein
LSEGETRNVGTILLESFPIRLSNIKPCAEIPAVGGDCLYSLRITNGSKSELEGSTWSLIHSILPGSPAGFTEFQTKEPQEFELAPGKGKDFNFKVHVPENRSGFGSFICAQLYIAQDDDSVFATLAQRDLFCVIRDAKDFQEVPSPQVQISDLRPCGNLRTAGGMCRFAVRVTNTSSVRLRGTVWSLVDGSGTGSPLGHTRFQTDDPRKLELAPGQSRLVKFEFRVPRSVADGASICAQVFVGHGRDPFFNTAGFSLLFCIQKGTTALEVASAPDRRKVEGAQL